MTITLPIPGVVSVVCLAADWLSGDRIQLTPGLPPGLIDFSLFLLGKLLVGNEFFHNANLLAVSTLIIAETSRRSINDL